VDTEKLRFKAFHKEDGGPQWIPCPEEEPIPFDILTRGSVPAGGAGANLAPIVGAGDGAGPS